MKHYILTCLLIIFGTMLFAQSPEPWFPFWNKDSTLIGFKDKNGIIRIEPRFNGLTSEGKSFIDRNFDIIKTKLIALNTDTCEYNIFVEDLNAYIFESNEFKTYFNTCGESKDWIYPVMSIVISNKEKKGWVQDHFDFLRTNNGYKLISISIRKGKLR